MNGSEHGHAATCRCLIEDLGFSEADCERSINDLIANKVIADFISKRTQAPVGQEVIQALAPVLIAYSLHSGRHRAATWFHEDLGVVWLLASKLHRGGSSEDAYPYFEHLLRAGRLLPTRADIARVVRLRARTFAQSLLEEAPQVLAAALEEPDVVHETLLGGRVRIRLLCESGEPSLLTVAISNRLQPGAIQVPPEWQVQVLAAVFSGTALPDISYTDSLGEQPLRADEMGYCAFIEGPS